MEKENKEIPQSPLELEENRSGDNDYNDLLTEAFSFQTISTELKDLRSKIDDKDNARILYDFNIEMVKEFGGVLKLGMTFCFGIIAAIGGYIFSQTITDDVRLILICCSFVISFVALFAGVSVSRTMFKGIDSISIGVRERDDSLIERTKSEVFFKGIKQSINVIVIISFSTLLLFSIGMLISYLIR